MTLHFYRCAHCGNIAVKVEDKRVPLVCCGEKMSEIVVNTTDAALEKHVPVVTADDDTLTVTVGSVSHPMTEEHLITFIAIETEKGFRVQYLAAGETPEATFALSEGETVTAVYAYCNLHGLWKA